MLMIEIQNICSYPEIGTEVAGGYPAWELGEEKQVIFLF